MKLPFYEKEKKQQQQINDTETLQINWRKKSFSVCDHLYCK